VAQAFNALHLIRCLTSSSAMDTLVAFFCGVVRSKIEFVPVAWNSATLPDFYKIEKVQKKFATLCYIRFFFKFGSKENEEILNRLNLSPLQAAAPRCSVPY
jgi:hypothetical protein